jgi:Mn-containing catalase
MVGSSGLIAAAAMRYFTQGLAEIDAGRKDLLLDIATEELSHLEVVGSIVVMLNQGVKGQMAEGLEAAELLANISGGTDSHTTALLYGGGVALTNSAGVPWTAAYVDSRTEPTSPRRPAPRSSTNASSIFATIPA